MVILMCVVLVVSLCLVLCMLGWCVSSVWLLFIGMVCSILGVCVYFCVVCGILDGVVLSSVVSLNSVVWCWFLIVGSLVWMLVSVVVECLMLSWVFVFVCLCCLSRLSWCVVILVELCVIVVVLVRV